MTAMSGRRHTIAIGFDAPAFAWTPSGAAFVCLPGSARWHSANTSGDEPDSAVKRALVRQIGVGSRRSKQADSPVFVCGGLGPMLDLMT